MKDSVNSVHGNVNGYGDYFYLTSSVDVCAYTAYTGSNEYVFVRPNYSRSPSTVSMNWTDDKCEPTETSAYIYTVARPGVSGYFGECGMTLKDKSTGAVIKTISETAGFTLDYCEIWYYVAQDLNVTLTPGKTYTYQFYIYFNGTRYNGPVKSFTTPHTHQYASTVTAPTCTVQGYTTYRCSVCGDTYKDNYKNALGHDFGAWTQSKAPTCIAKGEETRKCSRCDATETRELEKTGHQYVNGVCKVCGARDPDYTEAQLTVYGAAQSAVPGSTISIPVMISGGAGFAGFTLTIQADSGLTLKKIEKGALLSSANGMFTPNVSQKSVNWTSNENTAGEGELLILTFDVGEGIENGSVMNIALRLKDGKASNLANVDEQPVSVRFEDIAVTAQAFVSGDVNSDGAVDTIDSIRLARFLVDLVELTPTQRLAADVDRDKDVTTTDAIRLAKYLVGLVDTLDKPSVRAPRPATAETATISVGSAACNSGGTVSVPVTISQNPGFAGFTFTITAAEGLTLTDITKGALLQNAEGMFTKNVAQSRVNWTASEDVTGNGELMILTFEVSKDAPDGDYAVSVELKDDKASNFANANEAPVSVAFEAGTVTAAKSENPFTDVKADAYYYDPVLWAVEHEITSGTGPTTFSPLKNCTRAQVVTFLWRTAGQPEPTSKNNPFKDVKESAYYYKAVLWAVENNITSGVAADRFGPDASCTRAQIVTFLWRFEGQPVAVRRSNQFADVKADAWYMEALQWAVDNGITSGVTKTTFNPNGKCTRAQVVTFLYRANSYTAKMAQFNKEDYEIVLTDLTWEQAQAEAVAKGGRLVTFSDIDEYRFVLNLIVSAGDPDAYYYLGARRDLNNPTYYWADKDDQPYGDPLNDASSWCNDFWQTGEPNMEWKENAETVVIMYYYSKEARWCWYDGGADRLSSGRQYAYIIEYNIY